MAEDKKTAPGPTSGRDLTSKIARAYRSLPPEQRDKPAPEPDIQNPELDKAFDKMVDMYRVRRPERENAVVTFPAPPTLRVPKPETLPSGEDYECPECGHNNPGANQFCGMCGAAREDVSALTAAGHLESAGTGAASSLADSGVKHHHHHYHHDHYRNNPYLLAAVVLLLAVIAWQQWQTWQAYKEQAPAKPAAPAVQTPPPQQAPSPAQPAPSSKPISQTPASPPAKTAQPPKKPATQPASRTVEPVRQGEPPGPQVKTFDTAPREVPAPASYRPLTAQPMPSLPSFSSTPRKPEAPPPRVILSQGVSAGRLIQRVPPVYPVTAQRAGVQGEVVLQAVIAKDGSVQDVQVVSGNPALAEAAVQAVRQWRYEPYVLNGQPVEAETLVQVSFKR